MNKAKGVSHWLSLFHNILFFFFFFFEFLLLVLLLAEMVLKGGHNIFLMRNKKIYYLLPSKTNLIWSSVASYKCFYPKVLKYWDT